MNRRKIALCMVLIVGIWGTLSKADIFDSLRKAGEEAEKAKNKLTGGGEEKKEDAKGERGDACGQFLFSTKPINPEAPKNLVTSFKVGDYIYGYARFNVPIKEAWPSSGDVIIINLFFDGEKQKSHTVTIKDEKIRERDWIIFEIAPKPEECNAYVDPNVVFGVKAGKRCGPMIFTEQLSTLKQGTHEIRLQISRFAKDYAVGAFEIEGEDFSFYKKLSKKIAEVAKKGVTFPSAKQKNEALEKQVRELLMKAGWPEIYRMNIVDKDWWVQQGEFRYISVAVMAKDDKGWFYKICQFKQDNTLSGYGPLTIWDQGARRGITEENKDK